MTGIEAEYTELLRVPGVEVHCNFFLEVICRKFWCDKCFERRSDNAFDIFAPELNKLRTHDGIIARDGPCEALIPCTLDHHDAICDIPGHQDTVCAGGFDMGDLRAYVRTSSSVFLDDDGGDLHLFGNHIECFFTRLPISRVNIDIRDLLCAPL